MYGWCPSVLGEKIKDMAEDCLVGQVVTKWKTRRVGHPRVLEISYKAVFIHTVTTG